MASQPVATVIAVFGRAAARNENGELRPLQPGDTLLQGETVITAADGRVELAFLDGSTMEVTPDQSILMTAELFEAGRPDAAEGALAATTAERILQALEQEEDIDAELEPPAAGLEGGEEGDGSSFVRLLRVTEEVDPLTFEFAGTAGSEPPTFAEALLSVAEDPVQPSEPPLGPTPEPPPVVVPPTVNPVGGAVLEAALLAEEGAVFTQTLGIDFGSAGSGTVALTAPGATWNAATNTLTAGDGSWQAVVNDDGTYTFTLLQAMDHRHSEDGQSLGVVITVTVTDAEGNESSAGFTVAVWDDLPGVAVGPVDVGEISLATSDAETVGGVDTASASFAAPFAAAVAADYGADGFGSFAIDNYTLTVTNTDSGLTSGGVAIMLRVNADGVVEGRADDALIFTVAVNEAGTVTLTQHGPIDHAGPGGETVEMVDLPVGTISLSATVTVTDADGNTASETVSAGLGGVITFGDDIPRIDVGEVDLTGISLATSDAGVTGGTEETTAGTSVATAAFGAAFLAAVTADHGADGPGGVTLDSYALSLNTNDSGLTSGGDSIYLYLIAGEVVGSTAADFEDVAAANTVFTLSVDSDGEVTLTQFAAIDHGAPESATDEVIGLAAGVIGLSATATVTDADGDTASDKVSVDLGGLIAFGDDFPKIDVDEVDLTGISLATSDAEVTGGTEETTAGTSVATASFGAAFLAAVTADHGADGPGGEVTLNSYALSLATPDSGLTSGGEAIYLYLIAGEIVGSTAADFEDVAAANTVFSLSVDSDGTVTLTQYAAIDHGEPGSETDAVIGLAAGLIGLSATVTVTDADGDTASETLSVDLGAVIAFGDDAPTIEVVAEDISNITLITSDADTVDGIGTASAGFAGFFTIDNSSYGADGLGATSWGYALGLAPNVENGVDSGLRSAGDPIYLYLINGEIVGSTANEVDDVAGGNTVFILSVNDDHASDDFGQVTLNQYQAIDHGAPESATGEIIGLSTGLVVLTGTATITDADLDTVSSSQSVDLGGNIFFADDGPTVIMPKTAYLLNEAGATVTKWLDIDGDIDNNIGADQPGTVRFAPGLDGTDSGLTAGGQPILYSVSENGEVLTGYTEAGDIFTITLNHNPVGHDTYTVEMIGIVDGAVTTITFEVNGGYAFVGGNGHWAGFNTGVDDNSQDLLLTPIGGGTVNTNANSGGVGGGSSIGAGEAMRVDFVVDLGGTPASGGTYNPDNPTHTFDGHYEVNGASAKFTSITGGGGTPQSAIRIKAFDDFDDNHKVGDGQQDSITAVGIRYNNENVTVAFSLTAIVVTVGGHDFTVAFLPDGDNGIYEVVVSGIVSNTTVSAYTADGYNSIEYWWEGGQTFQIGDFGTSAIEPGIPVDFSVPVEIVDADGDVASGTINVNLLPQEAQDYSGSSEGVEAVAAGVAPHIIGSDYDDILIGDAQDNILYGGDGDDVIIGGPGNDILAGGLGADTFVWQLGDQGTADSPAMDTVTDFNLGEGDVLSLGDLLPDLTDSNLDQYIAISEDNGNTIIHIDTAGDVANSFNQVITLEGVNLSETELVNHILANLKTDSSEM